MDIWILQGQGQDHEREVVIKVVLVLYVICYHTWLGNSVECGSPVSHANI